MRLDIFQNINHAKKYPSKSKQCTEYTKGYAKSHFLSFISLKHLLKNTQSRVIAQITTVIPQAVRTNCRFVSTYKFTTKYANIPNNAAKNAIKSVLHNSIFSFTNSNIFTLYKSRQENPKALAFVEEKVFLYKNVSANHTRGKQ